MKECPMIFGPKSVKKILAGRKTQTRRVTKPQPDADTHGRVLFSYVGKKWGWDSGDLIWVRETWAIADLFLKPEVNIRKMKNNEEGLYLYKKRNKVPSEHKDHIIYRADFGDYYKGEWRSPIDMPRRASRIKLLIKDVWLEELYKITQEDVKAEGYEDTTDFVNAWNSINAERGFSWRKNPWVWVITFEVVT